MTREELHQKVLTLPKEPGVYIMKNKQDYLCRQGKGAQKPRLAVLSKRGKTYAENAKNGGKYL